MKKILGLLLIIISFNCWSQKVLVDTKVLKWALEKDDSLQVFKHITLKQDSIINLQSLSIELQNNIIKTYENDSVKYNSIIKNQEQIILETDLINDTLIESNNQLIKKNKFIKIISVVGIIVALII